MSSPDEDERKPIIHEVEHFRQRYNWDCGVSCVMMLLPDDQRELFLTDFTEICEEEGFGQSTWSIDLCYLLKRFSIEHHMYTTVMGVNESYKIQNYYSRIIDLDRHRVQKRFYLAPDNNILVTKDAVTMDKIVSHLREHGPVILLVDAGLLVCNLCKHNKLKAEFRRCFGGSYRGHYILLVGMSGSKLLYRDPALRPRICAASLARLHAAREAPGTDHDTIFVFD